MARALQHPARAAAWESARSIDGMAAWEGGPPSQGEFKSMENTLLIGLSRQTALQRELDVVANNIANVNTTGFKADGAVFAEFLQSRASAELFAAPDRRMSFVQDRMSWHDMSQGTIQQTGGPLDVAIDGEGMLVVQTAARRALHPQRRVADQQPRRARDPRRRQGAGRQRADRAAAHRPRHRHHQGRHDQGPRGPEPQFRFHARQAPPRDVRRPAATAEGRRIDLRGARTASRRRRCRTPTRMSCRARSRSRTCVR